MLSATKNRLLKKFFLAGLATTLLTNVTGGGGTAKHGICR